MTWLTCTKKYKHILTSIYCYNLFTGSHSRFFFLFIIFHCRYLHLKCVPLATEPGISLIILPLMRILQLNDLKRTTDTFLLISHKTNVLLFKFRCNIFIGVRIIKEMPSLVASGTSCIFIQLLFISTSTTL